VSLLTPEFQTNPNHAMSTQTYTPLNGAQSLIYTQTNLRRAFPDFEEGEVASIHLRDNHCIVARIDGSHETYERQLVVNAYLDFRSRLKDFFSYLGPNYRGPSPWRNEMYVMFKGWHHAHALGHLSRNAQLQALLADKFTRIEQEHSSNPTKPTLDIWLRRTGFGFRIGPFLWMVNWMINPNPNPCVANLTAHVGFNLSSVTFLYSRKKYQDLNQTASISDGTDAGSNILVS
jgi:hypothetical protein